MMKICYYKTKSVETLAAWGCCLNFDKGPAWIGKLSSHSAGSGVLKTGSVPAFNNVIVTTPASSVVKIPLGGRSAVEYRLSIWFLSRGRLVLPLWVDSQAMRCDENMIIFTGRDTAATFTSLLIVASLLRFARRWARRCGSWIWSVECLVGDELAVST